MADTVIGGLKVLLQADTKDFQAKMTAAAGNIGALSDRLARDLEPSQRRVNAALRDFLGTKEINRAKEYAAAVEQMAKEGLTLTEANQKKVNRAVQEALGYYKALGQQAPAELLKLAESTKQVEKSTGSLSGALSTMKGVLGAFGVQLGVQSVIGFGKAIFDAADQIGDLALTMGVSTEAAQRFQYAARQSGAEIEDVSASVVKMSDNLAEGSAGTRQALEDLGLSFERIRYLKPEQAFREIADAIGRIQDPMKQAQLAIDLWGKSGTKLLPMVKENSLAAADAVEVMSDDTIQDLKDAKQAWEDFFNFLIRKSGIAVGEAMRELKNLSALAKGELGDLKVPEKKPTFTEWLFNKGGVFGMGRDALDLALGPFAARGAEVNAAMASMPGVASPFSQPGGAGLAKPPKVVIEEHVEAMKKLKEEQDKAADAAKRHAKEVKDLFEAYTGADKRERIALLSEAFGKLKPENIEDWARLNAELNELVRTGQKLTPQLEALRRAFALPMAPTNWGKLLEGAQKLDTTKPPDFVKFLPEEFGAQWVKDLDKLMHQSAPKASTTFAGDFKQGLTDSLGDLDKVILQAFTGGGRVGSSIASLFGGSIGRSIIGESANGLFSGGLGKKLQESFLGKHVGGALANLIPGIGAMVGPLLDQAFAAIGNIGKNKTLQARQDFAQGQGFGSLNALLDKLSSTSAEGKLLADMAARGIGKGDKSKNEQWMKDVTAFFEKTAKNVALVTEKLGLAQNALQAFGGSAPKALRPLVDELLKSSKLTADQRVLLEGMQKAPSWQTVQQRAETLGIDLTALGPAFQQARIKDTSFGYLHDIEMFVEQGADRDAVLTGMADEISSIAEEAVRSNRAIPKALEVYVRRLQEMGLLIDAQGNAINDGLIFAEMEDESLKQVVSVLEEIRDLLSGSQTPAAVGQGGAATIWSKVRPAPEPSTTPVFDLPSFASGTHGDYLDFGPGTPVLLHGRERVLTEAEAGGTMTVIVEAGGRAISRIVAPYIPGEVKRLGLGRT